MERGEEFNWKKEEQSAAKALGAALTILLGDTTNREVISVLTGIVHRLCDVESKTHRRIDILNAALRNYVETGTMAPSQPQVVEADEVAVANTTKWLRHWANYVQGLIQDKELGYWPPDYFAEVD